MHFDNNGTTFLLPEVRTILRDLLDEDVGNPASISVEGKRAGDLVETAREHVAELLGGKPEQIVFTSSGSEANITVIQSVLRTTQKRKVVISEIEHSSLTALADELECRGVIVARVPATSSGVVDESEVLDAVDDDTAIVSIQMVNNETGVIQPYRNIARICRENGTVFHSDAAQAVGKMRFRAADVGADFLTFTAHKFHGPQGVGAIWSAEGWEAFAPLLTGGSQEFGKRSGTHNVMGIVGFGEAARVRASRIERVIETMQTLRNRFEIGLKERIPQLRVNGDPNRRVCNTTNLQFPNIDGKALYLRLLASGISCSQTSACKSRNPEPSEVLQAMGLSFDEAYSSIRFSFSEINSIAEVDDAIDVIARINRQIERLVRVGR